MKIGVSFYYPVVKVLSVLFVTGSNVRGCPYRCQGQFLARQRLSVTRSKSLASWPFIRKVLETILDDSVNGLSTVQFCQNIVDVVDALAVFI